jgi:hypothetical protein
MLGWEKTHPCWSVEVSALYCDVRHTLTYFVDVWVIQTIRFLKYCEETRHAANTPLLQTADVEFSQSSRYMTITTADKFRMMRQFSSLMQGTNHNMSLTFVK